MLWILLIVFQLKHFLADYILQGKYMLGKFKETGWFKPLAAHCLMHLAFTFSICFIYSGPKLHGFLLSLGLAIMDFLIHLVMDRIKASPRLLGRFKALSANEMKQLLMEYESYSESYRHYAIWFDDPKRANGFKVLLNKVNEQMKDNKYFWWSLGLDQMVHHLTDILIIYILYCYGS